MKDYKYDIAISLCKQDVDFAQKLVKILNPSLNIFFYEDRQEELISKSGPEAFANIFKEQARVIVILSRKEWGKSFYTELENDAILDRLSKGEREHMYSFLFVIPLVSKETPTWYPTTRIYADAGNFSIEQLARFIEFKVTEEGGIVKPITLEDRYEHILNRLDEKKKVIQFQMTQEAIGAALQEIATVRKVFNEKLEVLAEPKLYRTVRFPFMAESSSAHFQISDFRLNCNIIIPDRVYQKIATTQDVGIEFQLCKNFGDDYSLKILDQQYYGFYYIPERKGWAIKHLFEQVSEKEVDALFYDWNKHQYYDLINIANSRTLVDSWFKRLFNKAVTNIERYI